MEERPLLIARLVVITDAVTHWVSSFYQQLHTALLHNTCLIHTPQMPLTVTHYSKEEKIRCHSFRYETMIQKISLFL